MPSLVELGCPGRAAAGSLTERKGRSPVRPLCQAGVGGRLMHPQIASRIMRTTIDIDDPILVDLRRLQQREGKSLGRLVSDLLTQSADAGPTGTDRHRGPSASRALFRAETRVSSGAVVMR